MRSPRPWRLSAGITSRLLEEADAAIKAIMKISGTSSIPNMYWTIFLVARVFANLSLRATPKDTADRGPLRGMAEACRALST